MNEQRMDYTFSVFWSEEDESWVGICHQFSSLSCLEGTDVEALVGIYKLVKEGI